MKNASTFFSVSETIQLLSPPGSNFSFLKVIFCRRTSARALAKGSFSMAMNYVSVTEKNLTKGINQLLVEDALPDGYVEDAINVEVLSGGIIEKRKGYVSHLGEFPLRPILIDGDTSLNILYLQFASNVKIAARVGDYVGIWLKPEKNQLSTVAFPSGVFSSASAKILAKLAPNYIAVSADLTPVGAGVFTPSSLSDCVIYGLGTEASHTDKKDNWVQHIDSFTSTGTNDILRTVVCANKDTFYVEQPQTTQFTLPGEFSSLVSPALIAAPVSLQPGFSSTASSAYRSKFDGGGEGWASILSITFNPATSLYDVLLSTPNMQYIPGSISPLFNGQVPNAYTNTSDALTLSSCEFSVLNGKFSIHHFTPGAHTTLVSVYIQAAVPFGADYNCGATGRAGIFTQKDKLSLVRGFAGDRIFSSLQPELDLSIHAASGVGAYFLDGVTDDVTVLPQTLLVTHEGYIHDVVNPFITPASPACAFRGMTLNYDSIPYEVKRCGAPLFNSVSLSVNNEEGVLTDTTSTFNFDELLQEGDWVLLRSAGIYSKEYRVKSTSPTILILDMPGEDNSFGTSFASCNNSLVFYERISTHNRAAEDFVCEGLWRPLTPPSLSVGPSSFVPQDYQKHLRAFQTAQPPVRSVAVANTLLLNNGTDEPLAFDGFAIRRAGLFPWKPIQTLQLIPGTALVATKKYRYYSRLEYVDQSGQLQAGNTSSANDFKVTAPVGGAFASFILSVPPVFAGTLMEWDRLFISLYRTQADELPFVLTGEQFHLVERIPVAFNQDATFLYFVDKMTDSVLATQPADNLIERTRGLAGSTLQLASDFSGPPRALFNTTLNGRLLLANSREYPSAEVTFSGQYDWSTVGTGVSLSLLRDGLGTLPAPNTVNHLRFSLKNIVPSTIPLTSYSYNAVTGELTVAASAGFPGQFCWAWDDTSTNKQVAGFLHMKNVGGSMVTIQKGLGSVSFTGTARFLAGADIPVPLFTDSLFGAGVDTTASLSTKSSTLYRIAAVMTMAQQGINRTFPGWATWSPIMTAVAGNDLANTESILFSLPIYSDKTPAVKLSGRANWGGLTSVYTRGESLIGDFTALLLEKKHIARVHFSFPEFPEVFSVGSYADINAADGQGVTGLIPFFSNGTNVGAGAAGQETTVVIFKTNSIYLLKINPNGTTAVVKLETQGLGCTAPYSIAPTNNGIMFANETGGYRLGQNNQIEPIGRNIERLWKGFYATQTQEGLLQSYGHHFGKERTYRLSLPLKGSSEPTDSLSYNHTNEGQGSLGAWSRHTQMPYLQWCNLLAQEYVATTRARVFRQRDFDNVHNYVDGEQQSIPAQVDTRMTDFGDPSTRKRVLHLTCTFRTPIERSTERNLPIVGTTVAMAINQSCLFTNAQEYVSQGNALTAGLSEEACIKSDTIRYSLADTKSSHFQVRLKNDVLYSPFELSSISYRVAGLTTKGETEAVDTSTKAGRRLGYISGALTPRRN
jgi:hypothetical protein